MKHKTKDEIIGILSEIKEEVKKRYKAEIKGIFGPMQEETNQKQVILI